MPLLERLFSISAVLLLSLICSYTTSYAQQEKGGPAQPSSEGPYMFSYFTGNGEDGLHLAYSSDGLQWKALNNKASYLKPRIGDDKLMRDPSIVQGADGLFHMVWTISWEAQGIGYASSSDLIHWSEQKYIPVMEHEPKTLNTWAPELFYDEEAQQYLIVWASTIPGRFPETDGQDADKYNHRLYYVTTEDFETFSETKIFYNKGFNVIDGAIFKPGDGYAMLIKDETNSPFPVQKNIRLAFSDDPTGPWSEPTKPITGDYWAEGPTALSVDGKWHVYFDKYRQGEFGVLVSEDLQEWEDRSAELQMPEEIRHGTAFKVPKKVVEKHVIHSLLEGWHRAAAEADFEQYFNYFASDSAIFMGTDATERWTVAEFKPWAKPYFDRGKAWSFTPTERYIYFSEDSSTAWFDESLDTPNLGPARGSGVLVQVEEEWKIAHYNLSIPIPNAIVDTVVKQVEAALEDSSGTNP